MVSPLGIMRCIAVGMTVLPFASSPANAHRISIGLSGFAEHLAHPVLTVHQAMLLAIVCVLLSRGWRDVALKGLVCFALGVLGGWGIQFLLPEALPSYWIVTYSVQLGGALVAAFAPVRWPVLAFLVVAVIGGVFGLDTYNLSANLLERVQPPLGAIVSTSILVVVIGWILSRAWPKWFDYGVRVAMLVLAAIATVHLRRELGL